jgi:hypothetical protein
MDYLKNKIIQLNEEKKQPINTKNGRKVEKNLYYRSNSNEQRPQKSSK